MRILLPTLLALIAMPLAMADAITIDGERHEGVYVLETERVVFVHFPEDGRVQTAAPASLEPGAVELATDEAARRALYDAWALARDARRAADDAKVGALPLPRIQAQVLQRVEQAQADHAVEREHERQTERPVTDGIVPRVDLRDVPLGTALKAMLRPMGLDYEVREGMVFISDPETLRTESWEPLAARVYDIKNFDATLPKIVVMNPGGFAR